MDFTVRMADAGCTMNRRAALLFAALGVAWGIPYLLVKVSVAELSPAALLLIRTTVAAVLLLPLAAARGVLRPTLRRWRPIAAYAAVEVVVPWLMIGHAEQRLASSTTGLLIAATPLMGVALGLATGNHERMGRTGWAGLLLGFVGVAALVGLEVDTSDRVAVLQLLAVVVGYAIGPMILARSLADESGLAVVGLAFGIAAVAAVGVLLVGGGWPTAVPSPPVLGALVVLSTICTVGAFLMLFALVGEVGAVRSTAVTYVNPAVAIVVGAIFLGEQITPWTMVGFVLVLAGSVLLTRRPAAADLETGRRGLDAELVVDGSPVGAGRARVGGARASGRTGGFAAARRRAQGGMRRPGRAVLARRR
jgi:drug/metabolite transporter (DMT)-like permease